MKWLLFGGSFNPVHKGHIALAEKAKNKGTFDKVIFIPAHTPPHKKLTNDPGGEERLNMLNLALSPYSWAETDSIELDQKGTSYSINTVKHYEKVLQGKGSLGFLIGDDLLKTFHQWKEAEAIIEKVELWVGVRDLQNPSSKYKCFWAENPVLPYSSTSIREAIKKGETEIEGLSSEVEKYIIKKGLYR